MFLQWGPSCVTLMWKAIHWTEPINKSGKWSTSWNVSLGKCGLVPPEESPDSSYPYTTWSDLPHLSWKGRRKEGTGGREQYLLFPLFVPLECGGASCLLGLVLQELCSSLFLFEHVELVIEGLLLLLQFLLLVLVELLQTVKLLVQLQMVMKRNNTLLFQTRVEMSLNSARTHHIQVHYLFLCFFELSLLLFDSLDEHLSHFLFFLLKFSHELVPLGFIRLLKTDRGIKTTGCKINSRKYHTRCRQRVESKKN